MILTTLAILSALLKLGRNITVCYLTDGSMQTDVLHFSLQDTGFHGKYCEIAVDECENRNCLNGGLCTELDGKVICACAAGKNVTIHVQSNFDH